MKRGRPRSARGPVAPRSLGPRDWHGWVAVLVCVLLALWVHRRALAGYFALDDLIIMEGVRGLRPAEPGLWRLLSRHLWFGAAVPLFGANPFPYHLVSWLLHGVNTALLFLLVRRWGGGRAAASLAAGLFGTSRLHLVAVHCTACIGEPLALTLALAMLLVRGDNLRAHTCRAALAGLAMLAKESVVLLPALLLLPDPGAGAARDRIRRAAPPLAAAAAVAAALVASGAGTTHVGGEAYARGFGANLFFNLMTYTRWALSLARPIPDIESAFLTSGWLGALTVTLALLALAWVAARRGTTLPASGLAWWLFGLAPVLPLLHHTYLYYLYIPSAGLALALGATAEWAAAVARGMGSRDGAGAERGAAGARAAARAPAVAALVLVALHAGWSDRLLAERYAMRIPGTGVPLDPYLAKSEIARAAAGAVARRLAGRRERVAFLVPESIQRVYSTATGETIAGVVPGSHAYGMLAGALDGGPGLRALVPNVDSVAFLQRWMPGYGAFELFAQNPTGAVYSLGRGPDGFAAAVRALARSNAAGAARELAEGALRESPDHAGLRFEYGGLLLAAGDTTAMLHQLEELVRRAPTDPLADRVRPALARQRALSP